MRGPLFVALLIWGLAGPAYSQGVPPVAVPVGTIVAERKPVSKTLDFVRRIEATSRVDIRARVKGYLQEVLFKEGDLVREGASLYRIEQEPYQAAVEHAEGALLRAQAGYDNAKLALDRAEELLRSNSGSRATRDDRLAQQGGAKGDVVTAEANLRTAKINLGYTEIISPIAGRIGRTNVTKGNVVGPESGVLTVIVSQDPMYVTFPVSQREFLRVQQSERKVDTGSIKVQVRFSDGSTYREVGRIDFVDVSVDRATDTITVRATFANAAGVLVDGQLVRVGLESGTPEEQVLIPQAALLADQQGTYVFLVQDGKAVIRRVKLGGELGPNAIVETGLSGGEQVVVEGIGSLRPGAAVSASPSAPPLARS